MQLFYGKTEDRVLGTIYVEAIEVQDRVTPCSLCGTRGVVVSARVSCTRTVQSFVTVVCEACKPRLTRFALSWYRAGTVFLRGCINDHRD